MSKAILNSLGQVVTIVRDDVPEGWQPPAGCSVVDVATLPANYTMAPSMEPIPSCTQRQIRLWLLSKGVTDATVRAIIAQIPDAIAKEEALIEYEYATVYLRTHPLIESLGAVMGFTSDQLDAAFREASQL